jgi:hypothetical protein
MFATRHLCSVVAVVLAVAAWASVALAGWGGAEVFIVAGIVAPVLSIVGIITERPRWPAIIACAASLTPAISVYILLLSLSPDFDP